VPKNSFTPKSLFSIRNDGIIRSFFCYAASVGRALNGAIFRGGNFFPVQSGLPDQGRKHDACLDKLTSGVFFIMYLSEAKEISTTFF
jgi:hypothetical protein